MAVWHGGSGDGGKQLSVNVLCGQPLTVASVHPGLLSFFLSQGAGAPVSVLCSKCVLLASARAIAYQGHRSVIVALSCDVVCCATSCRRRETEALAVAVVEEDKLGQHVQCSVPSKANMGGGQPPGSYTGGGSTEGMGREFSHNSSMVTARESADAGSITPFWTDCRLPGMQQTQETHLCSCGSSDARHVCCEHRHKRSLYCVGVVRAGVGFVLQSSSSKRDGACRKRPLRVRGPA